MHLIMCNGGLHLLKRPGINAGLYDSHIFDDPFTSAWLVIEIMQKIIRYYLYR